MRRQTAKLICYIDQSQAKGGTWKMGPPPKLLLWFYFLIPLFIRCDCSEDVAPSIGEIERQETETFFAEAKIPSIWPGFVSSCNMLGPFF